MELSTKLHSALVAFTLSAFSTTQAQVSMWSEDAESGTSNVLDFTSDSYPLIQSSVVSQGQSAFHLANPNFEDNWFEIDQTISVLPSTYLFFTSQLRATTPEQHARVQISTNLGQSWPNIVYSQSGNGFPGESTFDLKSVPLSSFSGQDIRVRFLLDFEPPGSAFTQTEVNAGWLVDDIQITSQFEKSQYSIGNPSADETLYLEFINRSRADALAEAKRQGVTGDVDVAAAIAFFGIDAGDIETQYQWAIANGCLDRYAQPLAFNESLLRMSELHSQDQYINNFQGHESSNNPPEPFRPGDGLLERAIHVGYDQLVALSENTFASARSVEHGHSGFEIDWGNTIDVANLCFNPTFIGQGMQNPAGHRYNIHNADMKEVGIGVVQKPDGNHVVTQNFGSTGDARFATGVVFEDLNGNETYDIGEGRSGVRIDSDSSAFFAISTESGAYSLPISRDGRHLISFTSAALTPSERFVNFRDGGNMKVDYIIASHQFLDGDFNRDGVLDVADLDALTIVVRLATHDTAFDLDGNGLVDQTDRAVWVRDIKRTYFGDADLDGEFNSSDFVLMFRADEYEDDDVANSTWSTGDFNGDAEFDSADFIFAFVDNGYEQGPRPSVVVPEPTGSLSILLAGLCLWVNAKRATDPRIASCHPSLFVSVRGCSYGYQGPRM